ncbi:MAG TPA: DNA polymerase IV [Candidatus Limnocylindrales bacterium]|nr:DNA polymerase IV [Candidatus Limnocylindrales bacterium]
MRIVAHLDMDAFFASVEEKLNPRYSGKPLIVGGSKDSRGVVSAANYPARAFGIHAGMPITEAARLCPDAAFVEGDPKKYVHISLQILDTLKDFTPIVEPFSIDEAFLDLTAAVRPPPHAADVEAILNAAIPLAKAIQRAVHRRVGLTASIGIAPNKYVAKMGSGLQKPNGLTVLSVERFRAVFEARPVSDLCGIGEKTAASLAALGIRTAGQIARFPREFLTYHFGLNGDHMQDASRGDDGSEVVPYFEGVPVKSMGHEYTLPEDLSDRERIRAHLLRLCDQVGRRLRVDGYLGRVIAVKFRDKRFKTTIRQRALAEVTDDENAIYRTACSLLDENWDGRPLRLVGVSVSDLVAAEGFHQHDLFATDDRRRKMTEAADSLRDRFGDAVIVRAGALDQGDTQRLSREGASRSLVQVLAQERR